MPRLDRHIFVCTNARPCGHPKGSCDERGGADVREALKHALAARGLATTVRANAAGCLDECARGPALVVYPEQTWYVGVTVADVDEIVDEHLVGGRPVTRLLLPG